jgi:hypothetical protein
MSKNNTIQPFIIQAMVMRFSEKESMQYLHDKGFTISRDSFYRLKRKIQESRFERLSLLTKQGFVDQHFPFELNPGQEFTVAAYRILHDYLLYHLPIPHGVHFLIW